MMKKIRDLDHLGLTIIEITTKTTITLEGISKEVQDFNLLAQ